MRLRRTHKDAALQLPILNGTKVYYTDNMKYKVIVSNPFKETSKAPNMMLITISNHPWDGCDPPEGVCTEILKALQIEQAADPETYFTGFNNNLKDGVKRFLAYGKSIGKSKLI